MGRFKIYDSKQLVSVINDSNYATCLLCQRTLKNIMGNIKRHYEQMHSVHLDASVSKTKKSRKKTAKIRQNDKEYKPHWKATKLIAANEAMNKIVTTSQIETHPAVLCTISTGSNNNLNPASIIPMSKVTENVITNSSSHGLNQKFSCLEKCTENKQSVTKTTAPQLPQEANSFTPFIVPQEIKRNEENKKSEIVSKMEIKPQLLLDNSSHQKVKLNEENDEIKIPCYSYINNIQISSLESCHQVDFLKCFIETKTQMNIPLTNFEKADTFQKALQTWKHNFQFNYSSQTVGEHIDRMAKKLQQQIIKMVANRIVYLKLDVASTKQSNVMLVNIQFINDFEIKVVTLSAFELLDDDLATYLKEKVLTTLDRFKIDISNVYSITKDNTKNIKEDSTGIPPIQQEGLSINGNHQTVDYCQHLSEQFPGHAIHFVASDVIKQLNENISQSRDSAQSLRWQLLQLNIKQVPLLDNDTSWFSVYNMIESLLSFREKVESNSSLLVEVDWSFAIKFVESYKPIVKTASMLQTSDQFIMGDFYREWLLCELELEELTASNEIALYLLDALRKRKTGFFENTSFLAALYLDPRFCFMGSMYLNDKQKEMAIIQLLDIFNKLKVIPSLNPSKNTDFKLNNRYSKLEQHVAACLKANVETITCFDEVSLNGADCKGVKESLQQLQFEERLSFNTNILDYWKMAKYKSPILAKIAEIALAAPATQATINRALNISSINLLKSKLNESSDIINNFLLLKFNQDLVDQISLQK